MVPLEAIGSNCPNLIDLQLINARLAVGNHSCTTGKYISRTIHTETTVHITTLGVQIRVVRGINIAWGNLDMLIRVSGLFLRF